MKNQIFTSPSQCAAVASSVVTYQTPCVLFSGETVSENSLSLRKSSEHDSIRGGLAVRWQWDALICHAG